MSSARTLAMRRVGMGLAGRSPRGHRDACAHLTDDVGCRVDAGCTFRLLIALRLCLSLSVQRLPVPLSRHLSALSRVARLHPLPTATPPLACTAQTNRALPMASNGRGSPSPAPLKRQSAKKPAFNVTSPALARLSTFAEYADRRHELLADIHDGLEDHVRKMEERARQALAHASAVAETCRAQETECLEYIEGLEDRVRDLHRAKRECAAELKALQTSTERSRQSLEKELHDLRKAVEETRRQQLLAQEGQQHYEMLCDAAKRRYELAEAYLKDFTAKVEFRFHEAVASLQVAAQERKRWADEQCALNEKRVRDAALQAEQSDFSAFLCRATEDVEETGAVKPAEQCAAAVEPKLMRDLKRDVVALAASVAARLQLIVEQQSAAEAGLDGLPPCITGEGCDSIYALCRAAARSTLEGNQESWKRDQQAACEAVSVSHATRTLSGLEVTVKDALLELCAAAASASSTPSAKAHACLHEPPTGAAAPLDISAANASVSSSASPPSPGKERPPIPVQASSLPGSSRRQSESVTFPERRLIEDFSWSTDAFATIFTPRK
ncbi:hypothetical protein, unknown function [Leishmania mexicana MHOM/GT/2001/U1103]|uniref:Uncharacterized protein n=1 Tax=Leishmania mexicana (strain MHOM/GT/2001/U1103) TaxID=929439 RepID=E9B2A0_LEIMU|nr:hypothetical protein, unknown function [Leishmania mexicana MHOM/GT/2001/U1103]CBZ29362.1 hypothetical protein, unknown function [Leishmania mexicana MHOM/GT/2001/U1103]